MRGFIVSENKLEIRQFKNVLWKKETGQSNLPAELKKINGLCNNIEKNVSWYWYDNAEYSVFAFFANIGKEEHPLIEISCVCTWYNTNLGGMYLTGRDKKTGTFFAPVVN